MHYSKINQKSKLKKAYKMSSGTTKSETSQEPSSALHLEGLAGYFRHRYSVKLFKNKTDSKVIEPNQCFLKKSYAVLIELNA